VLEDDDYYEMHLKVWKNAWTTMETVVVDVGRENESSCEETTMPPVVVLA
jgi:hypothetical protein